MKENVPIHRYAISSSSGRKIVKRQWRWKKKQQTSRQIRMTPNSFTNTYETKQLYKYVWQIGMTPNSFTNMYDTKQLYKYVWYQTALQIRMTPNSFTNTYDAKQLYKYVWHKTALQIRMTPNKYVLTPNSFTSSIFPLKVWDPRD